MKAITINGQDFISALKFVASCKAKNDTRYFLNGVQFEVSTDNKATLVATDGHRLAKVSLPGADVFNTDEDATSIARPDLAFSFIMDGEFVDQAIKTIKPKKAEDDQHVIITFDNSAVEGIRITSWGVIPTLVGRQIDGQYPAWKRVMPEKTVEGAVFKDNQGFNIKYIADALRAATHVTNCYSATRISSGENVFMVSIVDSIDRFEDAQLIVMSMKL